MRTLGSISQAKYATSPKGKATAVRYYNTLKYKMKRRHYQQSPKGRATIKKWRAKWLQTPMGKSYHAGQKSNHRTRSTNPVFYTTRVELMHMFQESCAICGKFYQLDFQIDHIIALCNGGKDDWDNLQPICCDCHKFKTIQDLAIYNSRSAP